MPNSDNITLTEEHIRHAFDHQQFEVHYQPQMSVQDEGKVIGAEAFIRLNHPEYGQISPALFIPQINQLNLM